MALHSAPLQERLEAPSWGLRENKPRSWEVGGHEAREEPSRAQGCAVRRGGSGWLVTKGRHCPRPAVPLGLTEPSPQQQNKALDSVPQ